MLHGARANLPTLRIQTSRWAWWQIPGCRFRRAVLAGKVLAEFGVPRVILVNRREQLEFRLEELLPRASSGILDRPE